MLCSEICVGKSIKSTTASKFYPSRTVSTLPLNHLQFGLRPTLHSNFHDLAFMFNNLSVGVGDRLEIGISPVFYLAQIFGPYTPDEYFQFSAKVNYFKSNKVNASLIYQLTHILTTAEGQEGQEGQIDSIGWQDHDIGFLVDYWLSSKDAIAVNLFQTYPVSFGGWVRPMPRWINFSTDYMHSFSETTKYTIGVSRTTPQGWFDMSPISPPVETRIGATLTLVRRNMFLSSPAIGVHHFVEQNSTEFTFATDFY